MYIEPFNTFSDTISIGCADKDNYSKYFHYLLWYEETILIINLKVSDMIFMKYCGTFANNSIKSFT